MCVRQSVSYREMRPGATPCKFRPRGRTRSSGGRRTDQAEAPVPESQRATDYLDFSPLAGLAALADLAGFSFSAAGAASAAAAGAPSAPSAPSGFFSTLSFLPTAARPPEMPPGNPMPEPLPPMIASRRAHSQCHAGFRRRAGRWKGPRLQTGKRRFGAESVPTRLILVGAKGRVTNRSWGT